MSIDAQPQLHESHRLFLSLFHWKPTANTLVSPFSNLQDNPMRLGLCSRSKDVIEPVLKPQWWVNCKDMAARSCAVVRDGGLQIIPQDFEATWFRWLENIRDW